MKMIHSCFLNSTLGSLELHFCIFQIGVFKGRRKKGIFLATRKCYVKKLASGYSLTVKRLSVKERLNHRKYAILRV